MYVFRFVCVVLFFLGTALAECDICPQETKLKIRSKTTVPEDRSILKINVVCMDDRRNILYSCEDIESNPWEGSLTLRSYKYTANFTAKDLRHVIKLRDLEPQENSYIYI